MHGQSVYGGSPGVLILGSTRCLCYYHDQGSTVFLYCLCSIFFVCSPYLVNSFKQCYLQVSAVIHSHKLADISISSGIAVSCSLHPLLVTMTHDCGQIYMCTVLA